MEKALNELTLADVSTDVEIAQTRLENVDGAMALLEDVFESEGVQHDDSIDRVKAITFVARLPMFLSAFNVICREIHSVIADLDQVSSKALDAYNAQKEVGV